VNDQAYFYRRKPIPLERQVQAVERLVLYPSSLRNRLIERGQIVDIDDEAVELAPENFRRPAGPILTREEVSP
jgi:hypothetical protein